MLVVMLKILACLIVCALASDPKFLLSLDPSCGQNYEVNFEINPNLSNNVGGVLAISNQLMVYFEWMSSLLTISKQTNQDVMQATSTLPLALNTWTAVKLVLKRRSIGLFANGATFLDQQMSLGHIHPAYETFSQVHDFIDTSANASIKNIAIACTHANDVNPSTNEFEVTSHLYRRGVDTFDCYVVCNCMVTLILLLTLDIIFIYLIRMRINTVINILVNSVCLLGMMMGTVYRLLQPLRKQRQSINIQA